MSVQFRVQLLVVAEDGSESTEDVVVLNKEHEQLEQLGLTLTEGKRLLSELRRRLLERQVRTFLAAVALPGDALGVADLPRAHGARAAELPASR